MKNSTQIKKFISLFLVVMQLLVGCGRSSGARLRDSSSQSDATFGISIDTSGHVRIGAETRGYTEVVGLGERGSRGVEWSPVSSMRDGASEVIRWVKAAFDSDVPEASSSAALERSSPLTLDGTYMGRVLPQDLRSATRSGKKNSVEEKYVSLAEVRKAVEGQYARSREITSSERDHALRVAETINQRLTVAAQRHNQRVSEVTTDLASLVEALRSVPKDSFKTDPATPSGAKLRRLSTYMAERSEELKANSGLPEATKSDLVAIAQTAAALADESYLEGDAATGDQLVEIAYETFEVAIGFTPVGVGVDLYKVALGRDLMGRELTSTDRVIAIAGVASLGLGGMLKSVGKGVALTKRMVKTLRTSGRAAEAVDHVTDIERVAVAAEKVGLKGTAELKEIASELGDAGSTAEKLVDVLDSAKNNLPELRKTVEFLKRGDIPSAQRREVIEAFTDNSKVVTLGEDTKVYRYWVEGFNGPKGHWVTRNKVSDPLRELALPNSGPYKEAEWILPKGTEILEGMAAPNFKQPGGAGQIFIPNPGVLQ